MDCDIVAVMEEGTVVELGPPAELLRTHGSRFAAMHKAAHY